jgi:gliding motility-associated lipoprotein GldH
MLIKEIELKHIVAVAAMCFVFIACKEERLASAEWEWEDQRWIHGDKKTLTMTAPDTTTLYKMDLKINHKETYPYNNLYVRTVTTYPSGKEVISVTSLELVNADGTWADDQGQSCCKLKLPLQSRFTFPEMGEYTWTVEPYMRIDTIPGIKSLEVICSPVTE